MFHQTMIIGNLGRDPETRAVGSTSVCNFSVAVTEKFKDRSGEKQERTTWYAVQAWGQTGEVCQRYLAKGSKVLVVGTMQQREYEKDGQKRTAWDLRADKVQFLTPRNSGSSGADSQPGFDGGDDEIPY